MHSKQGILEMKTPFPYAPYLPAVLFILLLFAGASQADLIASDSSSTTITLHWTAPGDDDDQGIASLYDIRYSTSMITDDNWNSAVQVASEPTPQAAGTAEIFTVGGLQPGTIYYFAIKAADEANNWSALSNIACDTTLTEQVPPSAIANLAATNPTQSTVTLTWISPGDDSTQGRASQYDIRYSTSPITEQNWDSAIQVTGETVPKTAGSQESFTVTGLQQEITYYFAIKTADEVPNWSGLSNVASACTPDQTAPARINDLSAITGENDGEIVIQWTAPGDDGIAGIADAYFIRVYAQPITSYTWNLALNISDPPAPCEPGSPQSFTITGLVPGNLYFIAMKTSDEAGNISYLSINANAVAKWNFVQDIDDELAEIPENFSLSQNYPNPFNLSTTIKFGLPEPSNIKLLIFDSAGRQVATIKQDRLAAGYHAVRWDGRNDEGQSVTSGVYFCSIQADEFYDIKKMVLLK